VTKSGAEIALTQREFEVLEYLAPHKGRTVTREMLGRDVWHDPNYALTNVVEVYIKLRKKLIRTGMYANTRLTAELPAAWAVPVTAVGKASDDAVMYLVEGGKAVRVVVQLLKGDAEFTQICRYKKAGATDWTDVTGSEQIATPASALTDGQNIP
jgi:hypothetical protein